MRLIREIHVSFGRRPEVVLIVGIGLAAVLAMILVDRLVGAC
jgi:hypothetical protein